MGLSLNLLLVLLALSGWPSDSRAQSPPLPELQLNRRADTLYLESLARVAKRHYLELTVRPPTAKELLAHHSMPIIYLTANSEPKTFQSAKETLPAAYLLKPFRPDELLLTIELAHHYFQSMLASPNEEPVSGQLFLPIGKGHEMININDVLYIEADGAYVKVVLNDKQTHTISTNLSQIALYFRTPNFFRLSRFHLVNLNYIKLLRDNGLVLSDNQTVLTIPAASRKELMKRLTVVRTK